MGELTTSITESEFVVANLTSWVNATRSPLGAARAGVSDVTVSLYAAIFLLAITGNTMVLLTLITNKRMQTVTNVYLLNLAVSDLLLGVFCMPFTLIGQILRNFIFGSTMCKLIPYFQAVSVSVAVWTLVAISLERYFAICRPLQSRPWQTQSHAYKMISLVWLSSLLWSVPILLVSRLHAIRGGRYKCREDWPGSSSERAYNLFLDMALLMMPLLIMSTAYSLLISKLWKGMQHEIRHNSSCRNQWSILEAIQTMFTKLSSKKLYKLYNQNKTESINWKSINRSISTPTLQESMVVETEHSTPIRHRYNPIPVNQIQKGPKKYKQPSNFKAWIFQLRRGKVQETPARPIVNQTPSITDSSSVIAEPHTCAFSRHAIRSNYMDRSIEAKKKVIRMLFVVVVEFFVCWAPLHLLNTWYLFAPEAVYHRVGTTGVSLIQLLAYASSCCNPITYCFMNRKFRQAFLTVFNWYKWKRKCCGPAEDCDENGCGLNGLEACGVPIGLAANNSDISGIDSTLYLTRACRSEVVVLEGEERV